MAGVVLLCLLLACICGFCAPADTPWSALFDHVLPVPLCCSCHAVSFHVLFFFQYKFVGLFCVVCAVSLSNLTLLTCAIHL
jgi:hypothetical protein